MNPDFDALVAVAETLLAACRAQRLKLTTAESCTGGLIAATLTEVAGSSDAFERGFVTYSNEAKIDLLGVPANLIEKHGAVSEAVARAMAEGALKYSRADISVSVTGVAGPSGGSTTKPVGLVHLAAARKGGAILHKEIRLGDIGRRAIRLVTVAEALALVEAQLR
jgi:nicotinamide-nucleotide amidase